MGCQSIPTRLLSKIFSVGRWSVVASFSFLSNSRGLCGCRSWRHPYFINKKKTKFLIPFHVEYDDEFVGEAIFGVSQTCRMESRCAATHK
jgi:hypothetical protein